MFKSENNCLKHKKVMPFPNWRIDNISAYKVLETLKSDLKNSSKQTPFTLLDLRIFIDHSWFPTLCHWTLGTSPGYVNTVWFHNVFQHTTCKSYLKFSYFTVFKNFDRVLYLMVCLVFSSHLACIKWKKLSQSSSNLRIISWMAFQIDV